MIRRLIFGYTHPRRGGIMFHTTKLWPLPDLEKASAMNLLLLQIFTSSFKYAAADPTSPGSYRNLSESVKLNYIIAAIGNINSAVYLLRVQAIMEHRICDLAAIQEEVKY